jgi:hypothetical protein
MIAWTAATTAGGLALFIFFFVQMLEDYSRVLLEDYSRVLLAMAGVAAR